MNEKERVLKCGRCGAELETIKAVGSYLDYEFTTDLRGCKNCGLIYVPEELVNTRIAQVEALLEGK